MSLNIAKSNKKRVVIVGGGFGGLKLANKLKKSGFQVLKALTDGANWFLLLLESPLPSGSRNSLRCLGRTYSNHSSSREREAESNCKYCTLLNLNEKVSFIILCEWYFLYIHL